MYIRKNKRIVYINDLEEYIPNDSFIDNHDDVEQLYNAIEELETNLKTIVLLRFFEDMKLCEIANITNTNLNTVKSRLYKALNLLRLKVEDFQ